MASFDRDGGNLTADRAFQLLVNSPVALYWSTGVLDETITWLTGQGYQVVRLDAGGWAKQADFHRDIKAALDFPDYYGHNLDALNDCMRDVAWYEYGADREATGTVLVFTGYDAFAAREPRPAQVILDILASTAHRAMLVGHRMLYLVQSDDPSVTFADVGAAPVLWNPAEWHDGLRR